MRPFAILQKLSHNLDEKVLRNEKSFSIRDAAEHTTYSQKYLCLDKKKLLVNVNLFVENGKIYICDEHEQFKKLHNRVKNHLDLSFDFEMDENSDNNEKIPITIPLTTHVYDKYDETINLSDEFGDDVLLYMIENESHTVILQCLGADGLDRDILDIDDFLDDDEFCWVIHSIKFHEHVSVEGRKMEMLEYINKVIDAPGKAGSINNWMQVSAMNDELNKCALT